MEYVITAIFVLIVCDIRNHFRNILINKWRWIKSNVRYFFIIMYKNNFKFGYNWKIQFIPDINNCVSLCDIIIGVNIKYIIKLMSKIVLVQIAKWYNISIHILFPSYVPSRLYCDWLFMVCGQSMVLFYLLIF